MNKKIIAIAIAAAMTAPVAMAEVKLSGRVANSIINVSSEGVFDPAFASGAKALGFNVYTDGAIPGSTARSLNDQGQSRFQIDGTSGKAFARIAYDARPGAGGSRDNYLGYKLSKGTVMVGRMAGALKNLEKDPYIATFLQARGTYAVNGTAYGSNGFVDNVVQFTTKKNGIAIKAQFNPGADTTAAGDEGHIAISLKGKTDGINWWAGYNNGHGANITGESTLKVGGSMKFGKITGTAQMEQTSRVGVELIPGDPASAVDNDSSHLYIAGDMNLGNKLSANLAFGSRSADVQRAEGTWLRLAVTKKLNAGTSAYAGFTNNSPSTGNAFSVFGAGMTVKF